MISFFFYFSLFPLKFYFLFLGEVERAEGDYKGMRKWMGYRHMMWKTQRIYKKEDKEMILGQHAHIRLFPCYTKHLPVGFIISNIVFCFIVYILII